MDHVRKLPGSDGLTTILLMFTRTESTKTVLSC